MTLRDATRELHHRAEQHPVGAAMADGTVAAKVWTDWLGALLVVHLRLDNLVPAPCGRIGALVDDIRDSAPNAPRPVWAAQRYADSIERPDGAFYVFTGAHLMGGAVIEKQLRGRLPCAHLRWADRKASLQAWSHLRGVEDPEVEAEARRAFQAVLDIMDEIHAAP